MKQEKIQKLSNKDKSVIKPINSDKVKNPHDVFFKHMCSNIRIATDLIKSTLDKELLKQIDLTSLQLSNKSFVDDKLREYHYDVIYKALISNKPAYIVILLEHQSKDYEIMAFRKLEYNVRLLREEINQNKKKLPFIMNICLYHGERSPYPHSTSLFDLFEDKKLAKQYMFSDFKLIGLSIMSDEDIETSGYAALMQYLFKNARDAALSRQTEKISRLFNQVFDIISIEALLNYMVNTSGDKDDAGRFLKLLAQNLPKEEQTIVTYRAQLKAEGVQIGVQLGMERGLARGISQASKDIAKNCLADGLAPDKIAKNTGLSLDEIIEISENRK